MNKTFFVSDTHFYHKRILEFCPTSRRGKDAEEMTELMVEAWNKKVPVGATVFALGDICFGNVSNARSIIPRLNGTKHLVYGNHDHVIKKNEDVRQLFQWTRDYAEITVHGIHVVLFHFPMREWRGMQNGHYHLFGHVHGSLDSQPHGRSMDVGVDSRPDADMAPWSFEEIHEILKNRPILAHHGEHRPG